jgi:D-beta-D-heptose 7-phosphate kinase/D-beta-D-heptose 1-phosphate adenosyltransferase
MRQEGERFLREQIQKVHVIVVGDIMLDRYLSGQVSRISPEAPVPVNRVTSEMAVMGGAANTAANLASLGCHVYVAGLVGKDASSDMLNHLFEEAHIDHSGLLAEDSIQTTTKVRVLGQRQQMIRLDFEEKRPLPKEEADRLLDWIRKQHEKAMDCLVISDYGKGVVTDYLAHEIISMAREWNIPVLVDPKGSDWRKYDGAFAITPNLKELSDCTGEMVENTDEAVQEAGKPVREKFHLTHLLVTRSEKGITAISENGTCHCPAKAQDVFDVSGAGDTVMAVTAAAVAAGLDMETVLNLANTAAGISVSHVGTYPVKRQEVLQKWVEEEQAVPFSGEALSWDDAERLVSFWKSRGEKVVFTNGCFDILHRGHLTYLMQAAALGDHLIVGLNSDRSVRELKGPERPINSEKDRAFMLAALRSVDAVVIFDEDTPEQLLSHLKPDILVKGGDYRVDQVAGRQYAGEVKILSFVPGYSTTNIINQVKKTTCKN